MRTDLMRARHRVSKLLLRRGIIYCDGRAWTDRHHAWLAAQHFTASPVQAAYESAYEPVVMAEDRRPPGSTARSR